MVTLFPSPPSQPGLANLGFLSPQEKKQSGPDSAISFLAHIKSNPGPDASNILSTS